MVRNRTLSATRVLADWLLGRVVRGIKDAAHGSWSSAVPNSCTPDLVAAKAKEDRELFDDDERIVRDGTSRWDITEQQIHSVRNVLDANELRLLQERLALQVARIKKADDRKAKAKVYEKEFLAQAATNSAV